MRALFFYLFFINLSFAQSECIEIAESIFKVQSRAALDTDTLVGGFKKERVLKQIDEVYTKVLDRGVYTQKDLHLLVEGSYALELGKRASFLKRLASPNNLKKMVKEETRKVLITKDLESAFKEMGILSDPSILNSFRVWRSKHKQLEALALSSAINYTSIATLGIPIHLPTLSLMRGAKLPANLLDDLVRDGFELTYPKLLKHYRIRGATELTYNRAKQIYVSSILVIGGYFLYEYKNLLKNTIQSLFITNEKLDKLQEETFDIDKVRLELLQSWKEGYFDFEEKWPTDIEVAKQWDYLLEQNEDDLMVNYSSN